jgi:hypothetical protein
MSEALEPMNQDDSAGGTALRLPKASLRLPLVSAMLGLGQLRGFGLRTRFTVPLHPQRPKNALARADTLLVHFQID